MQTRVDQLSDLLSSDLPIPDRVRRYAEAAVAIHQVEVPPPAPVPPRRGVVEMDVVAAAVEAAEKGKPRLPDAAKVLAADKAREEWQQAETERRLAADLLKTARKVTLENATDVLGECVTEVCRLLTGELEPLVAEVRELAPQLRGMTTRDAIRAGDTIRASYLRMDELAVRYSRIRMVQYLASEAAGGAHRDEVGYFTRFSNLAELWPGVATSKVMAVAPWPQDDDRKFLQWLGEHPEYVTWCPTPAQRDEAYARTFGEKVAGQMGLRAIGV